MRTLLGPNSIKLKRASRFRSWGEREEEVKRKRKRESRRGKEIARQEQ